MSIDEEIIYGNVLSIQSHVVHGYVGNRAAVLPLQLLGFEVDFINSVQYSNHTQYKVVKGQKLSGNELEDLCDGLRGNEGLWKYSHVLTGYIGTETFLRNVLKGVLDLKKINPNTTYVCDPVLGDNGYMYVPKDLMEIYKNEVIQHADVITPNQFEAELLSESKINSEEDALKVIDQFHSKGISTVILTSVEFEGSDELVMYGSNLNKQHSTKEQYKINFKKLDGVYTGTGDLFASLFLAFQTRYQNNLKKALEKTLSGIQLVLSRTPKGQELNLIKCRNSLQDPENKFDARKIQHK